MSYPRYFVTYTVMSDEAGANPFWHSLLILTEQQGPINPFQVKDVIGYYSQPSTTTNPIIGTLKDLLGFKIDLQDGHGRLMQEELRYLDATGLYGKSFEIEASKYEKLQELYKSAMKDEAEAIEELNDYLHQNHLPANGHTRFIEELGRAQAKAFKLKEESAEHSEIKPEPRLKPFHVTMDYSFKTNQSYTCKNRALDFLLESKIIESDMYQKLLGGEIQFAFPRCPQSSLHEFQLVSTGEPTHHLSERTGKTHWSRSFDNGGALYWTMEPTAYEKPNLTKKEFRDNSNIHLAIKNILIHTRELEKSILRRMYQDVSASTEPYFVKLKKQLHRVQSVYEMFIANSINQGELTIRAKLLTAETILNVAKIALTPQTANYPFLRRAFHNISLRYALLGLLLAPIVSTVFTGIVSLTMTILTTLFFIKKLGEFIQTEIKEAAMRQDYNNYRLGTEPHKPQSSPKQSHLSIFFKQDPPPTPILSNVESTAGLSDKSSSSNDSPLQAVVCVAS